VVFRLEIRPRRHASLARAEYKPYLPEGDLIPALAHAGGGVHRPEAILQAILEAAQ